MRHFCARVRDSRAQQRNRSNDGTESQTFSHAHACLLNETEVAPRALRARSTISPLQRSHGLPIIGKEHYEYASLYAAWF
jgi:hypothetical protein